MAGSSAEAILYRRLNHDQHSCSRATRPLELHQLLLLLLAGERRTLLLYSTLDATDDRNYVAADGARGFVLVRATIQERYPACAPWTHEGVKEQNGGTMERRHPLA